MNADEVDLGSLDPARDPEHWDRLVASVALRAWTARRRRRTVVHQRRLWARPALTVAATVTLGIWAGALLTASRPAATVASQADPAFTLARWASTDESPPTASILMVLGDTNAER